MQNEVKLDALHRMHLKQWTENAVVKPFTHNFHLARTKPVPGIQIVHKKDKIIFRAEKKKNKKRLGKETRECLC